MFEGQRDADWSCNAWNAKWAGKPAFTADDGNGYKTGRLNKKKYQAHRIIWCMLFDEWPEQIDHINGDRSDNRASNLRSATQAMQNENMAIRSDNTSGRVGVSFYGNRWNAEIYVRKKHIRLGRFNTFEEACSARSAAEIKYGFHQNHGKR